ncbi:MAG: exosome complex protein Rrp42 [Candidatus Aenigmarchaeota archaeon]|nr:exosome complex protein Rrp42 [Candidatus Aenigmarchaeota archaeon]
MRPDYILKLLENEERMDGRRMDEFRKIKVETQNIKKAEGSARVKMGNTDVIVGVKMEIGTPFLDTPNMGILKTGAEFTPIASPDFESGPPGEDATELARVIDRGIRESESIDLEKLCLNEGEKVWKVFVDAYIINHDGNLTDASALAAIAALKVAKIPKLEDDKIIRDVFEKDLPLLHTPITVTIGKVADKFIIDPNREEEEVLDAKLTVAVREDGMVCAMQKSGSHGLTTEDVEKMIDLAIKKSKELRKLL